MVAPGYQPHQYAQHPFGQQQQMYQQSNQHFWPGHQTP